MPNLELNGTELHVQTLGQSGAAPVVMIHGLLIGNMASWYFSSASKLSQDHEVILYDLRGHGMSAKAPAGYDLATMVDDLEALIAFRKLEGKISIVGHSYGGLVALHFALRHPGRVERLVIVEAPLPPSKGAQMDAFLVKSPDEVLGALPEHLRALILTENRQAKRFVERLQFLLFETELLANLKKEADVPDEALRGLQAPTLLVYALNGQLQDVGKRLAAELPQARLEWLDGGHYLPSEKPQELTEKITEFFR